jgi:hypothetical protein
MKKKRLLGCFREFSDYRPIHRVLGEIQAALLETENLYFPRREKPVVNKNADWRNF